MRCRFELRCLGASVFVLVGGCLAEPQGLPRTWPPPLADVKVAAIAAGDVDEDGVDDLAVVLDGSAQNVFLLRGGADLDEQGARGTFSKVARLGEARSPCAAMIVDLDPDTAGKELVIVHATADEPRFDVLQGPTLSSVKSFTVDVPTEEGPPPWMRFIPFGPGGNFLFLGLGRALFHFTLRDLRADSPALTLLPPPMGAPSWGDTRLVASFGAGASERSIIASLDRTWRVQHTPETGPRAAEAVRSGEQWTAQVAVDVDRDGAEDVVGVTTDGRVCAINVRDAKTYGCVAVPRAPQGPVELVASGPELFVVGVDAGDAALVAGLRVSGDALQADVGSSVPPKLNGPVRAVGVRDGRALLIGSDGEVACLHAGPFGLEACERGGGVP